MLKRREVMSFIGLGASISVLPRLGWSRVATTPYATPAVAIPAKACDCHVHVFDPQRFPYAEERVYTPDEAPLPALREHLQRLHFERVILVQPSPYGSDNSCMLDALRQLGPERARGVAVVAEAPEPRVLQALHADGVRGLRLNLETFGKQPDPTRVAAAMQTLARAIADLGWHLQLYTNLATVAALAPTLQRLPVPVVLDHFGHLDAAAGQQQPGYAALLELLASGRLYVKLSALYRVSTQSGYADVAPFVTRLAKTRPDRLLWATDWPHTMPAPGTRRSREGIEHFREEDDGFALDQVLRWVGDPQLQRQVLVDNPDQLYWA